MNILDTLLEKEKNKLQITSIKKGKTLFNEDEICNVIGVILEGKLRISTFSYGNNEIIFNEINKGEMFGNNLIFSSSPYFKGDVVALEDTSILLINKDELLNLFKSNEYFLKEFLKAEGDFTIKLNTKIKLLSFNKIEDKLNYYLFVNNNEIKFKSVVELAKILQVAREPLSRLISKLVKEKKIIYMKGKIERVIN